MGSLLSRACMWGHHLCVKLLISRGAKVDQVCPRGQTPLFVACNQNTPGSKKCVERLLSGKAEATPLKLEARVRVKRDSRCWTPALPLW